MKANSDRDTVDVAQKKGLGPIFTYLLISLLVLGVVYAVLASKESEDLPGPNQNDDSRVEVARDVNEKDDSEADSEQDRLKDNSDTAAESDIVVTGLVYTSGASVSDDGVQYFTVLPQYQIAFVKNIESEITGLDDVEGYFLEDALAQYNLSQYEGSCIEISGSLNRAYFDNVYQAQSIYHKRASVVLGSESTSISVLQLEECLGAVELTNAEKEGELQQFESTLIRTSRRAPDMADDYGIGDGEVAGYESSHIQLYAENTSLFKQIEESVGKKVSVKGYIFYGYAEAKSLIVTEVRVVD